MENKFPEGIRFYPRNEKAPNWVVGKLSIEPEKLTGQQVYNVCVSEKDPFDVKYYVGYGKDDYKAPPAGRGSIKYPAGILYEANTNEPKWILGRVYIDAESLQHWATKNSEDQRINFDVKISTDGNIYLQVNTWKPNK